MPARVVLLPRRALPFYNRHPWVFPGAIGSIDGEPADGDEVELVSNTGTFVAWGLFNSKSKIRVRLYSWQQERRLDREFFREQLQTAQRLRILLGLTGPGRAYRLVFSEADGLSGLTIDRYDRFLTVQISSLALALRQELLLDLLLELFQPEGIYLRTERGVGQQEGLEAHDHLLWGYLPDGPVTISDSGLQWHLNIAEGQKTGFYLDQRDNRLAVGALARGRRVLDAFCYSGGFGLQARRAGASEVVCVDSSEPALALARENAQLNQLTQIQFVKADVFDDLGERGLRGERFGVVILDPPRFARSRNAVEEALRAYRRLQTLAVRLLEPDGILVVCCCSGLITMDKIEELLSQTAAEEKRAIQVLERRGPAPDHPVAVSCLESHYLKCFLCRVC